MATVLHRLRTHALTWHVKNLPSRIAFHRARAPLTLEESSALADLKRDGIALTHISKLFPSGIWHELITDAAYRRSLPEVEARIKEARAFTQADIDGKKGSFLVDLWRTGHEFNPKSPFSRFSVSAPVLRIVNAYLELFGRFREFHLEVTVPVPKGVLPFASQRWHADPDDRRMTKVFLYLNDVDESAGPFTYVKGSHESGRYRHIFPFAPKVKSRHPDSEFIRKNIPVGDIAVNTGKAGTIIFCDTSGIHRGGYATDKERIMYTSVYTSPGGYLPTRLRLPEGFAVNSLTMPDARATLGGKP